MNAQELSLARTAWAAGPVEARALVRASGEDARAYVNRMSTQKLDALAPGETAFAALLDAKGHLLADLQVLGREDGLLLELDPAAAATAIPHLEKFVIADDVTFEDLSAALRVIPVLGPEAAAHLDGVPGDRLESRRRGVAAVDLVVPAGEAEVVRAALVAKGAASLDADALELLRVEGGRSRWGAELDGSRLPMEAGLTKEAISFFKGCYVGQEVVMRATARGRLQKGLVLLGLPPGAAPGAKLQAGGQEVGWITSAVDGPDGRVGLGYLRRAHWTVGERVAVTSGGEAEVRKVVVEEPEL